MKHFFERLEREIDFSKEYMKLERMVSFEIHNFYLIGGTINIIIENNFRNWRKRGNFTSFSELRIHLGFSIYDSEGRRDEDLIRTDVNMEEYFLYCEMLLNLIDDLHINNFDDVRPIISEIVDTLNYNVEKSGFEIKTVDGQKIIVEKNAVSIFVADNNPNIADLIIEYNHYLLRGNIKRKQEILKGIADALEPKQKELYEINKSAKDDFFWMVNNLNVRHNNCDCNDKKNYNPKFAELSPKEKEKWYDLIYDQALYLFVLLNSKSRNEEIKNFKQEVNK